MPIEPKMPGTPNKRIDVNKVIKLYREGMTPKAIAERMGHAQKSIHIVLRQNARSVRR